MLTSKPLKIWVKHAATPIYSQASLNRTMTCLSMLNLYGKIAADNTIPMMETMPRHT
jgi:hypothetical protein